MAIASVQGALRKAGFEAGIKKRNPPSYIEKFGKDMPKNHLKIIEAITSCRTQAQGFTVYECYKCGKFHYIYRGCGNRHCPTCQNGKAWI